MSFSIQKNIQILSIILITLFLIFAQISSINGLTMPSFAEPSYSYLPQSINLEHTEGKGLGYSQGYSSIDLFAAQPFDGNQFVPFIDLRGHLFNKGHWATNAGLGIRTLKHCSQSILGINLYYDSLTKRRAPYHQLSLGLEYLTRCWEVHLNGYLPVGRKRIPIYFINYDFSSGFLVEAKEQFSLGGFDLEVGRHFYNFSYFNIYAGIGPYGYWGKSTKTENAFRAIHRHAIGGRLRTALQFLTYFELEGVVTYDSLFKWGGQATLSLNLPFEWIVRCGNWENCSCDNDLNRRLFQPVIRNEIIVVKRMHRYSNDPAVLDPENEP